MDCTFARRKRFNQVAVSRRTKYAVHITTLARGIPIAPSISMYLRTRRRERSLLDVESFRHCRSYPDTLNSSDPFGPATHLKRQAPWP